MKPDRHDLRNRLRPLFCAALASAAGLGGVVGLWAPAPWPPLHARCIGVMLLSLAAALVSARRTLDPAATRIPLLAFACWGLSAAAVAWARDAEQPLWPLGVAAAASAALLFARIDNDPSAPAQHADRAWCAVALLAIVVALPLLLWPQGVASAWPWRLPASLVAQYGPLFLAWAAGAWLVSRERRRYVRAPVLWGLLTWATGVLLVSLWHVAAFKGSNALAWVWFAGFAAIALLAAQRLGLWPHDSRTGRSRQ